MCYVTDPSRILSDYTRTRERAKNASSRRGVERSTAFEDKAPKPTLQGTSHHTQRAQRKSEATYDLPVRQDKGKATETRPRPARDSEDEEPEYKSIGSKRNEDLTLDMTPELGPREFEPNSKDPLWQKCEPNSGIRLRSVILIRSSYKAHVDMQEPSSATRRPAGTPI